jgi:hypothetical protein
MKTLEIMLECISNLQSGVDLRAILTSFMDRLSTFVRDHPEAVPADLQIFDLFHGYIAKISKDPSINLATMLSLQVFPPFFQYCFCLMIFRSHCSTFPFLWLPNAWTRSSRPINFKTNNP